jgi:hypothetical protein
MANNQFKKFSDLLVKITNLANNDPLFINKLEMFINSNNELEIKPSLDQNRINEIDLFQIIREKKEEEVEKILSEFNVYELRAILKKYRFGSPSKLKTVSQLKNYILNQLRQRKTDVFQNA